MIKNENLSFEVSKHSRIFNLGGGFGGFGGAASSGGGFKFSMSSNDAFKNSGKSIFGNTSESGEKENGEQEECTAEFAPVLNELPPEIEVKTGIEDTRAFLLKVNSIDMLESATREWKSAVWATLKFLKKRPLQGRNETRTSVEGLCQSLHLLPNGTHHRQQTTGHGFGRQWISGEAKKNFFLLKNFNFSSSDPDEPNGKYEQFCIKFKNVEIATEFKTKFEESQNALVETGNFTPDRDVSSFTSNRIVHDAICRNKAAMALFTSLFDSSSCT